MGGEAIRKLGWRTEERTKEDISEATTTLRGGETPKRRKLHMLVSALEIISYLKVAACAV
jgi:hypothetical protein